MILRTLRWLKPRFVSVDFVRIKHWPFTFCVHIDPTVLNQFALCLFTMSSGMQPNPFGLTTPLTMPSAYAQPSTTPWLSASQHHGSAERNTGGIHERNSAYQHLLTPTPHGTPPRSASRTGRGRQGSRSRERYGSPRNQGNGDEEPQQGWGPRIISLEQKIAELQSRLNNADVAITAKFAASQAEASILQGRVEGLERTLPQRIQMVENRQVTFVETLNAMTAAINQKIEQVEQFVLAQPRAAAPSQTVPPIPQSYGGPQLSQPTVPEHFQLGSPLSAPPGIGANQSAAPTPDPWASYVAGSQAAPPMASSYNAPTPVVAAPVAGQVIIQHWDERQWNIGYAKVSKELKPFNGSDSAYRTWAGRVRDHFKEVNRDWALVFAEIEKQQSVIPMSSQIMCYLGAPGRQVQVDFSWISNVLWTFLGKHIIDSMYGHRSAVASGPDNGVELWRAYFVKHEGGADQVELGGIDSLHTFPQCQKVEDLGFWLGKWIEMKDQYGQGMSDIHLRSRFLNILPEAVKKDVRETRGLNTLQDMIQHVQKDLGRLNDSKIAKLHAERLKQSLSGSHRVNAMTEVEEPPTNGPKSEDEISQFQEMINALSSKIDTIAAAADTKRTPPRGGPHAQRAARPERGPSDFAKFKGCLHCGGDHRVADCRIKKALLAKNNGKLPAGFKSAFDKWKATQPAKKVAALSDAELQDEDLQSESEFAWGITCGALTSQPRCAPCDFRHTNSFANIFEDDNYDDEADGDEHVLSALQQMTSNVSVGPKVSQRQRKDPSQRQPMDRRTVAAIAKRVRNGDYNLPDLQLESNDQYEAVWALVDSGAGRSCARRSQHFGHTKTELKPSSVKMATASGEELKSRGCFTIDLLSTEGHTIHQTFEDADVDMPILSVTEISVNGALGSDVVFRKSDGAIIDLQTNAASRFVKRRGVYFMKVYTLKNRRSGFTRPGAA